jgi:uncharacterized protein YhfF
MQGTAWILDLTHRTRRLDFDVPPGTRALAAGTEAVRRELGIALDTPIGLRALDAAPELLFVMPRAGQGDGWIALSELAAGDERGFALYVEAMLGGWSPPRGKLDVFHFGDGPAMAALLAHLVMKGVKRGTAGSLDAAKREGVAVPEVGWVSIVTDGFGYALCAIRTERVELVRFADIEPRHAWVEGEGDRTLEHWREVHRQYFTAEAARLGIGFGEDSIVFFEHFRLLAVLGRADP